MNNDLSSNFDVLLQKMLDGDISQQELEQLQLLTSDSLQMQEEVFELQKIEEALSSLHNHFPNASTDFLRGVEENLVNSLQAGKSLGVASGFASLASKSYNAIGLIGSLAIGGAIAWSVIVNQQSDQVQIGNSERVKLTEKGNSAAINNRELHSQITPSSKSDNKTISANKDFREANEPVHQLRQELQNTVQTNQQAAPLKMNENLGEDGYIRLNSESHNLQQELLLANQELEKRNNYSSIENIDLLIKIGILHHQLSDFDNAELVWKKAIKISQKYSLTDYEATCAGNLGLLEKSRGNIGNAEELFRSAVLLLQKAGESAKRWEVELQKIKDKN